MSRGNSAFSSNLCLFLSYYFDSCCYFMSAYTSYNYLKHFQWYWKATIWHAAEVLKEDNASLAWIEASPLLLRHFLWFHLLDPLWTSCLKLKSLLKRLYGWQTCLIGRLDAKAWNRDPYEREINSDGLEVIVRIRVLMLIGSKWFVRI